MAKTRAAYVMSQHEKFFDTLPEVALDELCSKVGIELLNPNIDPRLKITLDGWTLTPDRMVAGTSVYISVDGENWHSSPAQKRKDEWRDRVITNRSGRVLHVPAELLVAHGVKDSKKWWPWVAAALTDFLLSDRLVERLIA